MEATSEVLDGVEDRVESLRKAAKRLLADKVARRAFLSYPGGSRFISKECWHKKERK